MKSVTTHLRNGLEVLGPAMYRARIPLAHLRILPLGTGVAPAEAPIPDQAAPGWRAIAPGGRWGGFDQYAWLHGEATLPADWVSPQRDASYAVALRLLLGVGPDFGWPEGLLYINGRLLQGINQHHPDLLLPDDLAQPGRLQFDVRAWSGMAPRDHQLEYAELTLLNQIGRAHV